MLRESGLDPDEVSRPDENLPPAQLDAFWRTLAARAGSGFGLQAAELLPRGALRGPEYAFRVSATLDDGLRVLTRFSPLLQSEGGYDLRPDPGGGVSVLYTAPYGNGAERAAVSFALGAVLSIGRAATGVGWRPQLVRVQHPMGRRPAYGAFFGAPVSFEQSENALLIPPETLALPMRDADPVLADLLLRYLTNELHARRPAQSLADAVRTAILTALPEQEAGLESVARRLGISSRVLQKRLQQAGTSFQELLDHARAAHAKRYLLQPTANLSAAAEQLGYSDVTAFHRAFKRWTGLTPGEFRRRAVRELLAEE